MCTNNLFAPGIIVYFIVGENRRPELIASGSLLSIRLSSYRFFLLRNIAKFSANVLKVEDFVNLKQIFTFVSGSFGGNCTCPFLFYTP